MNNDSSSGQARRHGLRALVAIALCAFSGTALAVIDMLLVIPGVTGESTDATYPGAITVLAYSWGDSRPASPPSLSCFQQDLSLTKFVDTATVPLLIALIHGKIYPKVTLVVRASGPSGLAPYITFDMINAQLTSLSTGGSGGESQLTENISFHFVRPNYTYTPPTGAPVSANLAACP
jgi:type VI secretion system secreted protein Hcp